MGKIEYKRVNKVIIQNGIPYRVDATLFRHVSYGLGGLCGYTVWQFGSYDEFKISPRANGEIVAEIQAILSDEVNAAEQREHISLGDEITDAIEDSSLQVCDILSNLASLDTSQIEKLLPAIYKSVKEELSRGVSREEIETAERIFRAIYASDNNNFSFLVYLCKFLLLTVQTDLIISIIADYIQRGNLAQLSASDKNRLAKLQFSALIAQGKFDNALQVLDNCDQSESIIARKMQAYYVSRKPDEGLQLLSTNANPSESKAFWAAKCYLLINRPEAAIEILLPYMRTDRVYRLLAKIGGVPREFLFNTQRRVVLCAVEADVLWLEKFRVHLIPYERRGWFTVSDTLQIEPGSLRADAINSRILRANLIVLLISPDFLADQRVHKEILPHIRNAHQQGIHVCWVPLRPSAYQETEIVNYKPLSDSSRPLSVLRFAAIEQEITVILERLARDAGYISK